MSDKIIHSKYHAIPTVKWNHWNKNGNDNQRIVSSFDDLCKAAADSNGGREVARPSAPQDAIQTR